MGPIATPAPSPSSSPSPTLSRAVAGRMRGPGGLYNLGNLLGLGSGLALAVAGASAGDGLSAAGRYLAGSASALAISIAMQVFLVSGEAYYRAWSRGAPPMTQLGAAYLAKTLKELGFADEARVVPARPVGQVASGEHALDIKV